MNAYCVKRVSVSNSTSFAYSVAFSVILTHEMSAFRKSVKDLTKQIKTAADN